MTFSPIIDAGAVLAPWDLAALDAPIPDVEPAAPRIAIVIPCYDVARHIAGVIRSIPPEYDTIVCVDDASPDDTAAVIEALDDPRVHLVRHARNLGVGGAVKTGYREAMRLGADICVKMDGDGQMSAEDLGPLVAPLARGEADYAKGNRFEDLAALRRMPTARLFGNAVLSFASKMACGYWNMLDVSNGYTAIRTEVLRELVFGRIADRYFFETSMLIELNIAGARVADVRMPARYGDERSSLRIGTVMRTFPGLLVRGTLRRFFWRYLIQDFGVLTLCVLAGVPLVAFGVLFGAEEWWRSVASGHPATAGTAILAALPVIVGVQLLLAAAVLDVIGGKTVKATGATGVAGATPSTDRAMAAAP